jgi:hypothetical protein
LAVITVVYTIKDLSIVKLPLFSYTQQLITRSIAFAAVRSCGPSQGITKERIEKDAQNVIEGLFLKVKEAFTH